MSLNEVYKKDQDKDDDSISPGLTETDEQNGSLVDIFIQNTRHDHRRSHQVSNSRPGPGGPQLSNSKEQDHLYYQPPTGEQSARNTGRKAMSKGSSLHRSSGSFTQASRERIALDTQKKIDGFMHRQNQYEKRKERNLKKLTKEQMWKERNENLNAAQQSISTPRAPSTSKHLPQQQIVRNSGTKASSKARGRSSRSRGGRADPEFDSFEGLKDGVANIQHCDPHSTTSNLVMQTLRQSHSGTRYLTQGMPGTFSGGGPTLDSQQYLTSMQQMHPLLGQVNTAAQSHQQFMMNPNMQMQQPQTFSSQSQLHQQMPDYYRTSGVAPAQIAVSGIPRPNTIAPQSFMQNSMASPATPGSRPSIPPQLSQAARPTPFGAAGFEEEVLDEFPVPSNVHIAPKQTDISIEQRSFLQMQNAINQSSRFDDLANNGGIAGDVAGNPDSQNVTGIMMQALSQGPQDLQIGKGPGMSVTPIRHDDMSNMFTGGTLQGPSLQGNSLQGPSLQGVSLNGNYRQGQPGSQSYIIQPANQPNQVALETTQVIKVGSNTSGQQQIQKTNSISTVNNLHQQLEQQQQPDTLEHPLMIALNDPNMFAEGAIMQGAHTTKHIAGQNFQQQRNSVRDSNGPGGFTGTGGDIDMLDSAFAQEESRQIEAYYRSVNRDSAENIPHQLRHRRMGSGGQSTGSSMNALHKPRRSVQRLDTKVSLKSVALSPDQKNKSKPAGQSSVSKTDRKSNRQVKVCVSRLDSSIKMPQNSSRGDVQQQQQREGGFAAAGRSVDQSKDSAKSPAQQRQVNIKAVTQAKEHLRRLAKDKQKAEAQRIVTEHKKKAAQDQQKNMRDELYLSNKLTRQFIMVTSLVMQSEDLSEDSIFNYAQYTEFAIRFGLMSERAASEESDERALLYEMWCTLSRVHSDFAFIRVVNLKTMITAILGFPVALHRNPADMELKRRKVAKREGGSAKKPMIPQHPKDGKLQVVRGEGSLQGQSAGNDSDGFREADLDDEVPLENNDMVGRGEMASSRQPHNVDRSAGKSTRRDSTQQTQQSFDSSSQFAQQQHLNQQQYRQQPQAPQPPQVMASHFNYRPPQTGQFRAGSVIDEYEELKAAELGQLSSPSEQVSRMKQGWGHGAQLAEREEMTRRVGDDEDDDEDEQQYFFDRDQNGDEQVDYGEGSHDDDDENEDSGEDETTSQNEYAIDRAHKIGFFVDHFEFCMTRKDVRTVQRRFKLFQKNWREFQKKDLIVKKSVIVDDGATFQPAINKKSERLIRNKEQGNVEFPFSTRIDHKVQRRQKVWERDLPRGVKSRERLPADGSSQDDRGAWLARVADEGQTAGGLPLPFSQTIGGANGPTREQMEHMSGDYFTLGARDPNQGTFTSSFSKTSSQGRKSNSGSGFNKGLTSPQMTQRMEHIYQVGRQKMLTRHDQDKNSQDFEKQFEDCTFRPQISNSSRQLSMKRSFSKEEKPWMAPAPGSKGDSAKSVKSCASQQQLAERMQFSIQRDIQRKRMAQHQKQVKNAVIAHGGWPKDYEGGGQALPLSEHEQAAKKPLFKRYDGKAPARGASGKQSTRSAVGAQKRPRAKQSQLHGQAMTYYERLDPNMLTDESYPFTTKTSRANLQQPSPQKAPGQEPHLAHLAAGGIGDPGRRDSGPTSPVVKEFSSEPLRNERGLESTDQMVPAHQNFDTRLQHRQAPPQTMLHQHVSNSTQSAALRERTPSRTRGHLHMQSLETGGIHHQTDEQGRAPLESQSSVHNATTRHHSAGRADITEDNGTTNIVMNAPGMAARDPQANQAQLIQKAMEDLTVIQETTFEQTTKMMQLQATGQSDYVSNTSASVVNRKPLLFIEVDTNGSEEGGLERIEVFKGDDPRKLSVDFCRKHDYDEETQIVLQRQIEEKLKRAYAKLEAKMQEKRQNRLAEKFRERQTLKTKRQASQ